MKCQVCGATGAEPHFGGISCRACAAFFRRYVNSRKMSIKCTCKQRLESSHPCRHCRMIKCLAIGMIKCKVQATREKNKDKISLYPGVVSRISLLNCNIVPRECSNISNAISHWTDLDQKRKLLYGESIFDLNFTQYSSIIKLDTTLLWSLGESVFPDMKKLSLSDRDALISNFFPRWMIMESAIDYSTNHKHFSKFVGSEKYTDMLLKFYSTSMPKEKRMKDEDVINIFVPYWDWHYAETAEPIYKKKCDKVEYMSIFMLLLFDDAYTNISEEAAKLCRNLRKVILRELKGYQTDNNCTEMRFLDTMDILLLLEKAEEKIQEEILICGLNNVTLHDDFKAIMQVKKL